MAFKNPSATYTVSLPEWAGNDESAPDYDPDNRSVWTFRSQRTDGDTETIQTMQTRTLIGRIDRAELRAAQRRGDDIEDLVASKVTQETLMSGRHAMLQHMTVTWGGPEFQLPDPFTRLNVRGQEYRDPHSGQVPPVTHEYIGLQDSNLIEDVYDIMNKVWSGRTPAEQELFPEQPGSVAQPGGRRKRAAAVPVPADPAADVRAAGGADA